MKQLLLVGRFQWVNPEPDEVMTTPDDAPEGYVLEGATTVDDCTLNATVAFKINCLSKIRRGRAVPALIEQRTSTTVIVP